MKGMVSMMRVVCCALLCLLLAGCGGESAPLSDPANVALRYMTAKAAGDGETIRSLLCAAREADWEAEAASFGGVQASLRDASCTRQGTGNVVTCTGAIVAVYGLDTTEFPLSSYTMALEDGEYKWCGVAP
jgi:hypothetical protein